MMKPREALESWKYYASAGGSDKQTMVSITVWLLAFSAATTGYIVANDLIKFSLTKSNCAVSISIPILNIWASFEQANQIKLVIIAIVGFFFSFIALIVVLLYAGYATQNWDKADEIAVKYCFYDLLPEHKILKIYDCDRKNERIKHSKKNQLRLENLAKLLSKPRDGLAPIFHIFLFLTFLMFVVNIFFLVISGGNWILIFGIGVFLLLALLLCKLKG